MTCRLLLITLDCENVQHKMGAVCKRFSHIVRDDSVWKDAFVNKFHLNGTQYVNRIKHSSWKKEYLARIRLLRVWERHLGYSKRMEHGFESVDQIFIDRVFPSSVGMGNNTGEFLLASTDTGELRRGTNKGRLCKGRIDIAPNHAVTCVYIQDPNTIIYGTAEGTVAMVNLVHGDRRYFQPHHLTRISHLNAVEDNLMSCSIDGVIKLWACKSRELRHILNCDSTVTACALGSDHFVAVGCTDGRVRVWSFALGEQNHQEQNPASITNTTEHARVLDLVPNDEDLTCRYSQTRGLNVNVAESLYRHAHSRSRGGHRDTANTKVRGVVSVLADRNTGRLLAGDSHGRVCAYNIESERISHIHQHQGSVTAMTCDWKVNVVLSGSTLGTIMLSALPDMEPGMTVERSRGIPLTVIYAHRDPITHVSMDRLKIVSCSNSESVKVWNRLTGEKIRDLGMGRAKGRRRAIVDAMAVGQSQILLTYGNTLRMLLLDKNSLDIARHKSRSFANSQQLNGRVMERKQSTRQKRERELWMEEGAAVVKGEVVEKKQWEKRADQMNANPDLDEDEIVTMALAMSLSQVSESNFSNIDGRDYAHNDEELEYILQYSQIEK
eukprot:CFRG4586T1